MALSVLILWLRFVQTPCALISAIITSITARTISKQSLNSSNLSVSLLQLTSTDSELPCVQISNMDIMTSKSECFVGAKTDVNCNEFNSYDIVTKKNTRIRCPSVLTCAVCYRQWALVIPMLAGCANLINIFASCYV